MKNAIIYFLFPIFVFSQNNLTLTNNRFDNNLFLGFDNPFTIIMENESCKNLSIKIDNGTYKQISENCTFNISPSTLGNLNVCVFFKNKLIKIFKCEVILPNFKIKYESINDNRTERDVDLKSSGIYKIDFFKKPLALSLDTSLFGFDFSYNLEYRILIIRNGIEIFNHFSNQKYFDIEVKEGFQSLKRGDVIVFKEIKCISAVENDIIDDLVFVIE